MQLQFIRNYAFLLNASVPEIYDRRVPKRNKNNEKWKNKNCCSSTAATLPTNFH
jgi:hypothetical protein